MGPLSFEKNCKKPAEKSIEMNQPSDMGRYAYFASLIDSTRLICEINFKSLCGKAERTNIRAVIQVYVSIIGNNLQGWKYAQYQTGLEAIQIIVPCD